MRSLTSVSKIKRFQNHALLFPEGDFYTGFYVLLKGIIKVFKVSSKGKEIVVHIVRQFGAFADIPLFEGENYPVDAEALEDSLALFIPKESILELISKGPEISLKMLAGFAKRLKALVNQLENISSKGVPNRLAKYLVQLIQTSGTENLRNLFIKLTVSKSTIAAYRGIVTDTLSRTIRRFQNEHIIRVNGKKNLIRNKSKLKQLAE